METEDRNTIRGVLVRPHEHPEIFELVNDLKSFQGVVDGYIEVTNPFDDDGVCIVCNEEGKLHRQDLNRRIHYEAADFDDIICGNFLVVGVRDGEFVSMTEEQIDKYIERFYYPEMFIRLQNGTIAVVIENGSLKAEITGKETETE